jgi:hypothetical protein
MVFNATFKNISVISWQSILLVDETGVPRENHRPVAKHWQTLSHNVVSSTPRLSGIQTHNVNGNRHQLHRYNVDHDSPLNSAYNNNSYVVFWKLLYNIYLCIGLDLCRPSIIQLLRMGFNFSSRIWGLGGWVFKGGNFWLQA